MTWTTTEFFEGKQWRSENSNVIIKDLQISTGGSQLNRNQYNQFEINNQITSTSHHLSGDSKIKYPDGSSSFFYIRPKLQKQNISSEKTIGEPGVEGKLSADIVVVAAQDLGRSPRKLVIPSFSKILHIFAVAASPVKSLRAVIFMTVRPLEAIFVHFGDCALGFEIFKRSSPNFELRIFAR